MTPRELMPVAASLLTLLALALFPAVVGAGLRRPADSALHSTTPLLLGFEFHGAQLGLPGKDGSQARLSAGGLRLEAADTGAMLSTTKALVARDAVVHPVDGPFPRWHFDRVQLCSEDGPFEWFGPARRITADGEVSELLGPRGTFSIVEGLPVLTPPPDGSPGVRVR